MEAKQLSFKGELVLLDKMKNRRQAVELWLLNDEVTENGGRYVDLEGHKNGFLNTPILTAYVGNKIGDGHNFEEIVTPDGETKASFMDAFAERIVGWFDAEEKNLRIEEKDGKKWIVGKGYISTWYAPELTEKLRRQGARGMAVSIETLVWDEKIEDDHELYDKYEILGTTILGDDVAPAVVGANITVLSKIGAETLKKMTIKAASADRKTKNNKKTGKGEDRMFNIDELKAAFPACKVLAANDETVLLLNAENKVVLASAKAEDEKIVTEEKGEISLCVSYAQDENTALEVKVDDILAAAVETNASLTARLNEAEKARDAALATLSEMQKAENERRKVEIANCLNALAKDLETCYGKPVDAELLARLTSDESLCKYAGMTDAEGKYCGLEAAKKDMTYAYNEARMKEAKCNSVKTYAWEIAKGEDEKHESGIKAAISNILK